MNGTILEMYRDTLVRGHLLVLLKDVYNQIG
jgi:hypothetical protein